jgi:archaellum component FlaC
MENITMDFEQIEQQLQELRSRFSRANMVLGDLEEIQNQFEDLAKTYKQFKEDVKGYKSEFLQFKTDSYDSILLLQQSQEKFQKQFAELRDTNEIDLDGFKSQLLEYQEGLRAHDSYISSLQTSMSLVETHSQNINDIQEDFSHLSRDVRDLIASKFDSSQQAYRDLKKQIIITRYALIFSVIFLLMLIVVK